MKNTFTIFYHFFLLGFISFGGPAAHLGYFRKKFVEKLKWLRDEDYSKIVALSQFLPGPSSSQVGFTIGLKKGGILGAIFAFIGFTLPSFLLLYFFAIFHFQSTELVYLNGVILGLKLFAVVIVFDAVYGMFQSFCKSKSTIYIFLISSFILIFFQNFMTQIIVIILASIIGAFFIKSPLEEENIRYENPKIIPLIFFILPFILGVFINQKDELFKLFLSFYEVGSLVFGGGHVVLPLISQNISVEQNSFLVGYALAQGVPGPLFTIASYLGAVSFEQNPFLGALVATLGIFLPGFLLIIAFEKSFESYSKKSIISSSIIAINASVVAILFAAFCNPIFFAGVSNIFDFLIAVIGAILLKKYKISILYLLIIFCMYGLIKSI